MFGNQAAAGSAVMLRLAVKTAKPARPFHLLPRIRHPGFVGALSLPP
jgi:hypothetical protein